jgi:hypothetical protein
VEGVVFGDDTGKFHDVTSKVCEISVILHGELGQNDRILGRMYKKARGLRGRLCRHCGLKTGRPYYIIILGICKILPSRGWTKTYLEETRR